MRLNAEHHETIISFAEKHPEIITNSWSSLSGHQNGKKLWEMLSNLLNGLGYGSLTTAEYKRRIVDWKSKTKAKAAEIRCGLQKTGGGPPSFLSLMELEKRLLTLMGNKAYEGDKVSEMGISDISDLSSSSSKPILTPNICQIQHSSFSRPSTSKSPPTLPSSNPNSDSYKENEMGINCIDVPSTSTSVDHPQLKMPSSHISLETQPLKKRNKHDLNNENYNQIPQSRSTQRRRKVRELSQDKKIMNDDALYVLKEVNCNLRNINENFTMLNKNIVQLTQAVLYQKRMDWKQINYILVWFNV